MDDNFMGFMKLQAILRDSEFRMFLRCNGENYDSEYETIMQKYEEYQTLVDNVKKV